MHGGGNAGGEEQPVSDVTEQAPTQFWPSLRAGRGCPKAPSLAEVIPRMARNFNELFCAKSLLCLRPSNRVAFEVPLRGASTAELLHSQACRLCVVL